MRGAGRQRSRDRRRVLPRTRIDRLVRPKIGQAGRLALIGTDADGRIVGFHVDQIVARLLGCGAAFDSLALGALYARPG
jgi:hypothetical protein